MRVWSIMANLFGCLVLVFWVIVLYSDLKDNERQFNELRLRYAVDYATEAAFSASLEGGNLEISYENLSDIKISPSSVLPVFKSLLALSYDMSLSRENLDSFDKYMAAAVLVTSDGYYIATMKEVDTPQSGVEGSQYALKWGLKKPYVVQYGDRSLALNMINESWILAKENADGTLYLRRGQKYSDLAFLEGIVPDRQDLITKINKMIMDDINYNIKLRNDMYEEIGGKDFIYLPSVRTSSGINTITKPSFFVVLSGVDFAGSQKLEVKSVGGYTLAKKRRVLGFVDGGIKYYCYESQLPDSKLGLVREFFNTVDDAAKAGYRPHVDYLRKSILID